jgi:hypothetical protein
MSQYISLSIESPVIIDVKSSEIIARKPLWRDKFEQTQVIEMMERFVET